MSKIFRVTTDVTQRLNHTWEAELFIRAESEEQAEEFVQKYGRRGNVQFHKVKGTDRVDGHYCDSPQYEYQEGGNLKVEGLAEAQYIGLEVVDATDGAAERR
ncbi:MAG: hypothetical protein ABR973_06140 [Candidatus Acidiferrales bacterium]|jgi:hypothetical protein